MKKLKKIIALMCAMVMMLSMSTVAFAVEVGTSEPEAEAASGKASITVKGLDASDTVTVKIYKLATASNDGKWKFEDWLYTGEGDSRTLNKDYVELASDATEYTFHFDAMKTKVEETGSGIRPTAEQNNSGNTLVKFEDLDGAAYLVLASGSNTAYAVMGAKTYTYTNGVYTLTSATVNAKTTNIPTTKTANDKFVYAGETVTFTITTVLPAAKTLDNNKQETANTFMVYEKPENLTNLTLEAVEIGGTDYKGTKNITLDDPTSQTINGQTGVYTIDLSSLLTDHEGKTVVLTLTGVVSGDNGYVNTTWNNKTETKADGTPKDPGEVKGYTGDITITKYDESGSKGGNTLTGAKFSLAKKDPDTPIKFSQKTQNGNAIPGQYIYDKNGNITEVEVDENGSVKLSGLDEGTYVITETEAPEGYAINTSIPAVTISNKKTVDGEQTDVTENVRVSADVTDTKLASLPFTGGMGTTLFTAFGVIIMVAAAGLYFANKKKSAK